MLLRDPDESLSSRPTNRSFQSRHRSLQRALIVSWDRCRFRMTHLGRGEVYCVGDTVVIRIMTFG